MTGYIYKFTNEINNKSYIGQTNNIKTRYNYHIKCKRNDPFHNALRKYGVENFNFEILHTVEDDYPEIIKDELNKLEQYYILLESSKYPLGYNLTDGGGGMKGYVCTTEHRKNISKSLKGRKLSEEHKLKLRGRVRSKEELEKMSKNRKGIPAWNKGLKTKPETIKKCVESRQWFYKSGGPNKGKKLSEEQKKKLSEAHKGKKMSEECKEKLRQYNLTHPEKYEKMRGRKMSEERKEKISKALKGVANTKGKIWVHNNIKSTLIEPFELETYLQNNWVRGRILKK